LFESPHLSRDWRVKVLGAFPSFESCFS
jgi:hypothetical protein